MTKSCISAIVIGLLSLSASAIPARTGARGPSPTPVRVSLNPAFLEWQTNAEYRAACRRHGYRPSPAAPMKAARPSLRKKLGAAQALALPSRFNLCDSNWVTSVKNQQGYGTCWAFATMASLESCVLRNEGVEMDLSENHLLCNHGYDLGFNDGGNGDMAAAYLLRWDGPILETEDTYPNASSHVERPPSRHVQRMVNLPTRMGPLDNDAIKNALVRFGAVMASYRDLEGVSGFERSYNYATAAYYYDEEGSPNHAIAIVGWDDDYSASNFTIPQPPGDGAFIVKNSRGGQYGDSGYIYISYYEATLGMQEDMYVFVGAESVTNYGSIYQYDPLGRVVWFAYEDAVWMANVFTAKETEEIEAVGFYTESPNTAYQVEVYTGVADGNPQTGTLISAASTSGVREFAGYDTVKLAAPVKVVAGQKFSVVVKLDPPDIEDFIAIEAHGYWDYDEQGDEVWVEIEGYCSEARANAGESFINWYPDDDPYWFDISADGQNCCIKAYTKREQEVQDPLVVPALKLEAATCGLNYSASLIISGGVGPYTWELVGQLPDGLSLNSQGGVISGVPTVAGSFSFGVTVTDANGLKVTTANDAYSLTVAEPEVVHGDDFDDSVEISGVSGEHQIERFHEFSIEEGEPQHTKYRTKTVEGYSYEYASAWFKWRAPGSGVVTFTSSSQSHGVDGLHLNPTFLAIYSGDDISSVVRLAYSTDYLSSGDRSTSCSLRVGEGQVYRIVAAQGAKDAKDLGASLSFSWRFSAAMSEVVPQAWMNRYFPGVANFNDCAMSWAANGRNRVWEAYVAGLDPTNSASVFTASIEILNGVPHISWLPDLNQAGMQKAREYKIWGKKSLDDQWVYPTNALHHFFKVTVGMP